MQDAVDATVSVNVTSCAVSSPFDVRQLVDSVKGEAVRSSVLYGRLAFLLRAPASPRLPHSAPPCHLNLAVRPRVPKLRMGLAQSRSPCRAILPALHGWLHGKHAIAVAQSHLRQTLLAQLRVHRVDDCS